MNKTLSIFVLAGLTAVCTLQAAGAFSSNVSEATRVANERFGGDWVIFLSDDSQLCRNVRARIFDSGVVANYIRGNFAAVEVSTRSADGEALAKRFHVDRSGARIIVCSPRLNNLRLHVVALDHIDEASLLRRLKRIKDARTIDEYHSIAKRPRAPGKM